jgi:hypothetical protein
MRIILALLCTTLIAQTSFADTWVEVGSAGSLPGTANITDGSGSLDLILGNLMDLTEVDMYQIEIIDALTFSAVTLGGVLDVTDPQLFLFDSAGRAVYSNDDAESGLIGSQSELTAGHPFGPTSTGIYYLAISWFNNEPYSIDGAMFVDGFDAISSELSF